MGVGYLCFVGIFFSAELKEPPSSRRRYRVGIETDGHQALESIKLLKSEI